ncbi:MAG: hypothetical protein D6802_07650 [Ardenticatenia bacterium]|nr:MAG: hypothetical protein D6802_07650 [Ardenticatenia bacterium]
MRKIVKWLGIALASVITLVFALAGMLILRGGALLNATYDVQPAPVRISTDPEAIERGEYIFAAACAGCHNMDLSGGVVLDDPAIGFIAASNLTSGQGGVGGIYTDADFVRAIRHGVGPDGKPLVLMPSQAYWYFSDEELAAVIAYVKSVPAVNNTPGEVNIKPMGRILLALGVLDVLAANRIDHDAPRPPAPPRAVTAEYGEYLVNTNDCRACHGPDLTGAQPPEPGAPRAPNLTSSGELAGWSAAEFIATIRTGVSPQGHTLDPNFMPWPDYANLNDDDLTAIFLYLQSQPAGNSK